MSNVRLNGKFIKTRMAELGMSARDLAVTAGIGEATMYRIINGGPFESRTLGKVAVALECNPVDLIDSEGFESPHVDAPAIASIRT